MEEEDRDFTEEEDTEERRPHKGGRILRFDPNKTRELMASPMTVTCFKHMGCFDFCEMIQRVQSHPILIRVFISNINNNQVTLVGVTFTIYYLFKSIEKMAYTSQGKKCDLQMNKLFHHSLIRIIVLHHLNQLNISWETFIANDAFTAPHAEDMNYSSHSIVHSM